MIRWTHFNKNEKGSSLVLAVVIIMIITVLGTSLMLASLSHVKMASNQKLFSSDYYSLDADSEAILSKVDANLQYAENATERYIQERKFSILPSDTFSFKIDYLKESSLGDSITYSPATLEFKTFKGTPNDHLLKENIYFIGPTDELGLPNAFDQTYQMYFYQKYINEVANAFDPSMDESQTNSLSQLERKYIDNIYNELYFILAREILLSASVGDVNIDFLGAYESNVYYPQLTYKRSISKNSSLVGNTNEKGYIDFKLRVIDPEYEPIQENYVKEYKVNPVWTNGLTAGGEIKLIGNQDIYGSVYTNAWRSDNALDMNAGLNVENGIHSIFGNIYSRGNVTIRGLESELLVKSVDQGTIPYATNLKESAYVSNEGDFNPYFLDLLPTDKVVGNLTYLEAETYADGKVNNFWLYNRDKSGGNIYCADLEALTHSDTQISKGVEVVADNVWTYGDIIMEAYETDVGVPSKISILNNVIGLLDTSSASNPNDSSTVYNNSYAEGGKIYLKKAYVPGKAFLAFDMLNGQQDAAPYYYETLESITGNDSRLFSEIYDGNIGTSPIEDKDVVLNTYTYIFKTETGDLNVDFRLKPLSGDYTNDIEIEQMLDNPKKGSGLTESIRSRIESNVDTGVYVDYQSSDFDEVEGTQNALINLPALMVSRLISNDGVNYENFATPLTSKKSNLITSYSESIDQMKIDYLKKTQSFGFNETDYTKRVEDCVNISSIIENYTPDDPNSDSELIQYTSAVNKTINVDSSNKNIVIISKNSTQKTELTINLTRNFNGIIYVDGDITINNSSDVAIKGTVIATGNILINSMNSKLTLIYDEETIARIINLYDPIKSFFEVYNKGPEIKYNLSRYTAGIFTGLERFRVTTWRERLQ